MLRISKEWTAGSPAWAHMKTDACYHLSCQVSILKPFPCAVGLAKAGAPPGRLGSGWHLGLLNPGLVGAPAVLLHPALPSVWPPPEGEGPQRRCPPPCSAQALCGQHSSHAQGTLPSPMSISRLPGIKKCLLMKVWFPGLRQTLTF